jgi:uncharacterized membrane protein YebE (DUF533 family)
MTGDLLGAVLQGVFASRPRRSRRAQRFLGSGGLINANTVLAAAGLAWGAYETWQRESEAGSPGAGQSGAGAGGSVVPPVPSVPKGAPLIGKAERLVRIAVAAAHADGVFSPEERTSLAQQAKAAGATDQLAAALVTPSPLEQIVTGVTDPAEKATLYMVAFTVLRADEQVTGAERIFLARLASLLELSPSAAAKIEQTVAEKIDAQ